MPDNRKIVSCWCRSVDRGDDVGLWLSPNYEIAFDISELMLNADDIVMDSVRSYQVSICLVNLFSEFIVG